ncbi:hypothetical protein [Streptomyces sp. NPDC001652]|uniref:hypothetical protein n=1 Tax=Streptomyces sp. NPDC001652 TaxID=3154393 RepID=UPI00331C11FC
MASRRGDRHRDPSGLTVRPGAELKQQATDALNDRDREMRAFVVACLNALVADPDAFLERLNEHWPAEKPRGRPRKPTPSQPAPPEQGSSKETEN